MEIPIKKHRGRPRTRKWITFSILKTYREYLKEWLNLTGNGTENIKTSNLTRSKFIYVDGYRVTLPWELQKLRNFKQWFFASKQNHGGYYYWPWRF